MADANSSTINSIFSAHLDSPDGKEKLAAVAQAYVRDKLRENSFARKILPPMMVTKADMQVSVNHDTLVYVDEMCRTFRSSRTTGSLLTVRLPLVLPARLSSVSKLLMISMPTEAAPTSPVSFSARTLSSSSRSSTASVVVVPRFL